MAEWPALTGMPNQQTVLVVGAYVVHHVARPDLAFREICRVLRPGGRFVFVRGPRKWVRSWLERRALGYGKERSG